MSPSKRLTEETHFQRVYDSPVPDDCKKLRCAKCLAEFSFDSDFFIEPKFCPLCGRRAA